MKVMIRETMIIYSDIISHENEINSMRNVSRLAEELYAWQHHLIAL